MAHEMGTSQNFTDDTFSLVLGLAVQNFHPCKGDSPSIFNDVLKQIVKILLNVWRLQTSSFDFPPADAVLGWSRTRA